MLRKHRISDAEVLYHKIGCDSIMARYTGWNPYETIDAAREAIREFMENYDHPNFYGWAIELDGELIGTIGAYDYDPDKNAVELGLSIVPDCWNKGYATEALLAVISYLFETEGIRTICAWCADENKGSSLVMEKAGMKLVDIQKNALHVGDETMDKLIYEIRKE